MVIDTNTDFGARVARRLADEEVIWLTTVRPNGTPEPSPVWFLWTGSEVVIYSQPDRQKLKDIAQNGRVALSFNCTPTGGDVIILTGDARIEPSAPPATGLPGYVEKYRDPIAGIGMTPDTFAKGYSVQIRVTPKKLRGF
ncbi:MAG TPA: TIGR03667 family PPOX class F420-dependent oxidoreductase [Chloroflexota bacterium]|nr:TIGR03667 family PPOX class F420-dependent oxidoreductase [Chloroflexota bacterium]